MPEQLVLQRAKHASFNFVATDGQMVVAPCIRHTPGGVSRSQNEGRKSRVSTAQIAIEAPLTEPGATEFGPFANDDSRYSPYHCFDAATRAFSFVMPADHHV